MTTGSPIPAVLAALALFSLSAPMAPAQTDTAQTDTAQTDVALSEALTKATTDPAAFAGMAASSNMFEIESSKLALEESQDEEVRSFAQKMIDEHTAAGKTFAAAAAAAKVEVPAAMSESDAAALDALKAAPDFDQAYLAAQVKAHDLAVRLFQGFATKGAEGPLRDFAAATLPTLQEHQGHVQTLAGR